MKPLQITPDLLLVDAAFADVVGPPLGQWLEHARRDRREIDPDHVEAIERLVLMAEGFRDRNRKVPKVDGPLARAVEMVTVKQVHELTGLSTRAITKRCEAGTLRARQPGGPGTPWLIDADSIPKGDLLCTR